MMSKHNLHSESVVRNGDELNMPIDDDHNQADTALFLARQTAGISLSALQAFSGFNPHYPRSTTQGVLSCIHEMQQISCSLSGLDAASLVSLSSHQAAFASLSMVNKYHQKKKQHRGKLLVCEAMPEVINAARQAKLDVEQISIQQLAEKLDENVAAIVFSMPSPEELDLLQDSLLNRIRELGVLLYLNVSEQYWLASSSLQRMDFDLITLDVGFQCETGTGCYAVLSNKSLQPYLPTPVVKYVDNEYQLQTHLQNPFSIGPLNTGAGNIEALVRCYTQFKLNGVDEIDKQARKAVVSAVYLEKKLADSGVNEGVYSAPYSGQCRLSVNSPASPGQSFQQDLAGFTKQGLKVKEEQHVVTLWHLHYLTKQQLDSLVEVIIKNL